MAIDFNGSTDRIDYTNVSDPRGESHTFSCVFQADALANVSYLLSVENGSSTIEWIVYVHTDGSLGIQSISTTVVNQRRRTVASTISTGTEYVVTYTRSGNLAADISIYIDGVEASYDAAFNADEDGTTTAATGLWSIGAREQDDARSMNGQISEVGYWQRVLTTGEIAALGKRVEPKAFPNSLIFAPSLIREVSDPITGQAGTKDGTTVAAHHRIFKRGHSIMYPQTIPEATGLSNLTLLGVG